MHPAKATPPAPGGVNIVGVSATPWRAEVPKLQESPKQTAKVDGRLSMSVGAIFLLDLLFFARPGSLNSLPLSTLSSWVTIPRLLCHHLSP